MLLNRKYVLWLAASLVICAMLATSSFAGKGGKGNGNGGGTAGNGGTELPPVRYEIRYIEAPDATGGVYAEEMNNAGQIVGSYVRNDQFYGFLFDPSDDEPGASPVGHTQDLNAIVDKSLAPDWVIASANGINDRGDVVGVLRPSDSIMYDGPFRSFVIDMNDTPPKLYPIDPVSNVPLDSNHGADRINESGDIAGYFYVDGARHWYLYNPGWYDSTPPVWYDGLNPDDSGPVLLSDRLEDRDGNRLGPMIAGDVDGQGNYSPVFRIKPWITDEPEYLSCEGVVTDLNETGSFCGWTSVEVQLNKKRTASVTVPFLYTDTDGLEVFSNEDRWHHWAKSINANHDLLVINFTYRNEFYLHHADMPAIKLDDLVTGSQADLETWFSSDYISSTQLNLNSRLPLADPDPLNASPLNFGQILGQFGDRIFLLTPVAAP